jgi:hypothetical protein
MSGKFWICVDISMSRTFHVPVVESVCRAHITEEDVQAIIKDRKIR